VSAAAAVLVQTRTALGEALSDLRRAWSRRATLVALLVLAAALVPALGIGVDRLAGDLYLAAAAVGLGLAVGLGGLPVLGQGAFIAVGAFTAALLGARAGWGTGWAVLCATAAAAGAGVVVGLLCAWLRPALVAVVTWLVAWLVALGLAAFPWLSGGAQGLVLPEASVAGVTLTPVVHYLVALTLVVAAVGIFAVVARRSAGIALFAARQNRAAAEGLGVPVARLRIGALTASAALGGLSGALAVQLASVADVGAHEPLVSFELFVAVVLGGAVSPIGPVVGVAFFAALERLTEAGGLEGQQLSRVQTLVAALLVLAVIGITDRGLVPSLVAWRRERSPRPRRPTTGPAAPALVPPVRAAALEARGLAKRFGAVEALSGLDLELRGGTVHALIGPNGSGKTTALRLLAGTLAPDAGVVRLDGVELPGDVTERVRRGIVGTLQATAVFPELTVLDNAVVGARVRARHPGAARAAVGTPKARAEARATRAAARRALAAVGLEGSAHLLAGELDGAAQRRLMIAAALATEPRVLLLDEPGAGAGRAELEYLAEVLRRLRDSGLALLVVEHNLRLVRAVTDAATVLAAGRVIASGPTAEVLAGEPVRIAYLGRTAADRL
jgi:branched-chain amino acid transport system permease protein